MGLKDGTLKLIGYLLETKEKNQKQKLPQTKAWIFS